VNVYYHKINCISAIYEDTKGDGPYADTKVVNIRLTFTYVRVVNNGSYNSLMVFLYSYHIYINSTVEEMDKHVLLLVST